MAGTVKILVPCPDGLLDPHEVVVFDAVRTCPGGRPPRRSDLVDLIATTIWQHHYGQERKPEDSELLEEAWNLDVEPLAYSILAAIEKAPE